MKIFNELQKIFDRPYSEGAFQDLLGMMRLYDKDLTLLMYQKPQSNFEDVPLHNKDIDALRTFLYFPTTIRDILLRGSPPSDPNPMMEPFFRRCYEVAQAGFKEKDFDFESNPDAKKLKQDLSKFQNDLVDSDQRWEYIQWRRDGW